MTRTTKPVFLVIAALAIAIVAWQLGRRAERTEMIESSIAPAAPASAETVGTSEAAPLEESSATIEVPFETPVPLPPEEPAAVPAAAPTASPPVEPLVVEERPPDSPSRCLTLEASPSSVSAYGARGAAVQLVVRARNGCVSSFSGPGTYFRAVATSYEGFDLGSAVGRFSGEIRPFGTAETLIAIEVDPTRVRTWRVELR